MFPRGYWELIFQLPVASSGYIRVHRRRSRWLASWKITSVVLTLVNLYRRGIRENTTRFDRGRYSEYELVSTDIHTCTTVRSRCRAKSGEVHFLSHEDTVVVHCLECFREETGDDFHLGDIVDTVLIVHHAIDTRDLLEVVSREVSEPSSVSDLEESTSTGSIPLSSMNHRVRAGHITDLTIYGGSLGDVRIVTAHIGNVDSRTRVFILGELANLPVERYCGPAESRLEHELRPAGVKHHGRVHLFLLSSIEGTDLGEDVLTVGYPHKARVHLVTRVDSLRVIGSVGQSERVHRESRRGDHLDGDFSELEVFVRTEQVSAALHDVDATDGELEDLERGRGSLNVEECLELEFHHNHLEVIKEPAPREPPAEPMAPMKEFWACERFLMYCP
nr:MAG: capsid protein [ssDNA virus sp.]